MPTVSLLSTTPVKGLALYHPESVRLERGAVRGNREFFLVDGAGRLFNAAKHGAIMQVHAEWANGDGAERLALRFPDGSVVEDEVGLGEESPTNFWGRAVRGRYVVGPFSDALTEYVGRPIKLVRTVEPGGAFDVEVLTLLSDASVDELARRAGRSDLDGRRFRMLICLAGCEPHEEDTWQGKHFRVGSAVIRVGGPVPRCVITTKDPDTGAKDFDTLREIAAYRGVVDKDVNFGVYASVEKPGTVRLGDDLVPDPDFVAPSHDVG
jgi:uncharacterized protein YcbX